MVTVTFAVPVPVTVAGIVSQQIVRPEAMLYLPSKLLAVAPGSITWNCVPSVMPAGTWTCICWPAGVVTITIEPGAAPGGQATIMEATGVCATSAVISAAHNCPE